MEYPLDKETILRKKENLERIRAVLKDEFSGIDRAIDEVLDAMLPWFLAPGLQERPTVINLWGLTGTGKTSLVQRIADLIGMKELLFQVDLGSGDFVYNLYSDLSMFTKYSDRKDFILLLDEFQHARSVQEDGSELGPSELRTIWTIMDTGAFSHKCWKGNLTESIHVLKEQLQTAFREGVEIKDGKVVSNIEAYCRIMNRLDPCNLDALDQTDIQSLKTMTGIDIFTLQRKIAGLDGPRLLAFVEGLSIARYQSATVDCRQALVFTAGNLDEAYRMNGSLNPDQTPDAFREATLKLTVPEIKTALQKRFRNEHIARLGNTHIIYPALGSAEYRRIISRKLEQAAAVFKARTNIVVAFDESVEELIFSEGVYPSQGTRTVASTIERIVSSALGSFLGQAYSEGAAAPDRFEIRFAEGALRCYPSADAVQLAMLSRPCPLQLRGLRECIHDDLQALVSVHEAGHAVAAIILLGRIPSSMRSATSDPNSLGFVEGLLHDDLIIKQDLIPRLALHLAGRVAERLIFGSDQVTSGSSKDLALATNLAIDSAKQYGLCRSLESHRSPELLTGSFFHGRKDRMEVFAARLLKKAESRALKTLKKHHILLMRLAQALFEKGVLEFDEIEAQVHTLIPGYLEKPLFADKEKGRYVRKLRCST